jgi:hypothetical protein
VPGSTACSAHGGQARRNRPRAISATSPHHPGQIPYDGSFPVKREVIALVDAQQRPDDVIGDLPRLIRNITLVRGC